MLEEYKDRFGEALDSPKWKRDFLLSDIMTDMEVTFKIPMQRSKSYEKENPEVVGLYKAIAGKRSV